MKEKVFQFCDLQSYEESNEKHLKKITSSWFNLKTMAILAIRFFPRLLSLKFILNKFIACETYKFIANKNGFCQ